MQSFAKFAFWSATALVGYTYLGYAAWLWLRGLWKSRTVRQAPIFPSISIVMVVRDECEVLQRKITQLTKIDYPPNLVEMVLVSDGSLDGSNQLLAEFESDPRFKIILNPHAKGKAAGLSQAIHEATGEIVIFMDARQQIEASAVQLLMQNFADPQVGCVSGELMLGDPTLEGAGSGLGMYWKFEKMIRTLESRSGSVIGATGAFYAVRRHLLTAIRPETILDDVYIPMQVLRQGWRVVFAAGARIWDAATLGTDRDLSRKVRTLSGNYQLVQLAPWLLTSTNPARFEFVSHKLLRLAVPFALLIAFLSSLSLVQHPGYRVAFGLQSAFYLLAALSWVRPPLPLLARAADTAFAFALLNTAAMMAFANFIRGRKIAWRR